MVETELYVFAFFSEITLKTVVTFAVLSSSAVILVLVRYWQNYSRKKAMVEPPPNPQSVEVEVG